MGSQDGAPISRVTPRVCKSLLRLVILASVALSLLVVFQGSESADASFSGDFNCDTSVSTQDVVAVLGVAGGVTPLSSCANAVSVDCDGDVDVTDAIMLLKYLAAFTVELPDECSDINALIPGTSPADAADELYARISGDGSLLDVVRAVEESLARGGVSTGDTDGTIYTQAVEPAARSLAIPLEVENLAVAARTGSYQTDAAELGAMLAEFEWPFLDDGSTPGEQIIAMLKELVIGAQAAPDDPNAFAPLFLQNMTMAQDSPVDLSTGDAGPEDVHFDLLALRLLFAVFERQATYPDAVQDLAVPAATPCSDAKKVLEGIYSPFGGQLQGVGQSEAGSKFVEKGLEKAGVSAGNIEKIGKGLSVLGTLSKIWKLIDFYASSQVDVQIIDGSNELHKPKEDEADEERTFNATAGVSEADMKEYERANSDADAGTRQAVRDCMGSFGMPVFSDLGDLMKDAANWKIEWTIANNRVNLRNETAISWKPSKQEAGQPRGGNWRSDTVKTSEYSYEAAFHVDIGGELISDHGSRSNNKVAPVRVCGNVESAQPPDLVALTFAAKGVLGLVDSIAELAAGWIREVAPPQSCRTLTVTWHEPCPLGTSSADAFNAAFRPTISIEAITSLDQLPCTWTATGSASIHHSLGAWDETGEISGIATFGNPQLAGNIVTYEVISGSSTWQGSEVMPGICSFSGSGTYEGAQGSLIVTDNGSGQLTYSGLASGSFGDPELGGCFGLFDLDNGPFFHTCSGNWPLTDLILSGGCDVDQPSGSDDQFEWTLSGISCSGFGPVRPQGPGTCGGAGTAGRSASGTQQTY